MMIAICPSLVLRSSTLLVDQVFASAESGEPLPLLGTMQGSDLHLDKPSSAE